MHAPASRQPGANYAQRFPWQTKKSFRNARSSGDETLLGHLWATDCIWPSPFLLEHQNRWSGCQPRVHERPRGHSRRGNVSNLNILIQPTAANKRRSINLGLKLGQRRRRWTNVLCRLGGPFHIKHKTLTQSRINAGPASLMVNWHYTRVGAMSWVCQVVSGTPVNKRWNNGCLMMIRRHKRWASIKPALVSTTTIWVYWFNVLCFLGLHCRELYWLLWLHDQINLLTQDFNPILIYYLLK